MSRPISERIYIVWIRKHPSYNGTQQVFGLARAALAYSVAEAQKEGQIACCILHDFALLPKLFSLDVNNQNMQQLSKAKQW